MTYTSDLYDDITTMICLAPSGCHELKRILKGLDGEEICDDLDEGEDEDED